LTIAASAMYRRAEKKLYPYCSRDDGLLQWNFNTWLVLGL